MSLSAGLAGTWVTVRGYQGGGRSIAVRPGATRATAPPAATTNSKHAAATRRTCG
jgi:hypothetical protein